MERIRRVVKKKRPKGRGKGPQFERETAVALSLWWTKGTDADAIWRTASSGARFTNRKKKDRTSICSEAGDLKSTKESTKLLFDYFLIELKRGRTTEINLTDFLDLKAQNKRPYLEQVWEKSETEREACGRQEVMIIFKRNNKNDVVMLLEDSILFQLNGFSCCPNGIPKIKIETVKYNFVLLLFSDLILNFDPWWHND